MPLRIRERALLFPMAWCGGAPWRPELDSCYKWLEAAMVYLERIPAAPLDRYVRSLWYAQAGLIQHRRERILPTGCVQIVINLACDFLYDCPEGKPLRLTPPALVVGARSVYEIVDSSDMAELAGILFAPGAFACFVSDAADQFSNRTVALEDVWGARAAILRSRLREALTPADRMSYLEEFLAREFAGRLTCNPMVEFALRRFRQSPGLSMVRDVARQTGWSERRFSQVFREEVGLSPKVWCRIQRFQRAVKMLHAGRDAPWADLALDCGFYDQSHFANEFRAFSGIDATTYLALRTKWANHIVVD